jgi:hypothetical protein
MQRTCNDVLLCSALQWCLAAFHPATVADWCLALSYCCALLIGRHVRTSAVLFNITLLPPLLRPVKGDAFCACFDKVLLYHALPCTGDEVHLQHAGAAACCLQ